mmetsp:Transcript_4920/g.6494  ORF Transcript_4920/g.6494 Transcript_4920/m.6494 type:complete len:148 (-) Transcript_4920:142-585(-)
MRKTVDNISRKREMLQRNHRNIGSVITRTLNTKLSGNETKTPATPQLHTSQRFQDSNSNLSQRLAALNAKHTSHSDLQASRIRKMFSSFQLKRERSHPKRKTSCMLPSTESYSSYSHHSKLSNQVHNTQTPFTATAFRRKRRKWPQS